MNTWDKLSSNSKSWEIFDFNSHVPVYWNAWILFMDY